MFRRKKPLPPPDWSPFAEPEDWDEFEREVGAQAGERGWTGDIREGILTDGSNQFGLGNLAKVCAGESLELWPDMVREHFDICSAIDAGGDEFDNRGEARVSLRARLLDTEFFAALERAPLARQVSEDLHLVLAFDLPDRVMVAPRDEVLQWGPEDELFDLAIEQTRSERGLGLEQIELPDDLELWMLSGDSFFTATHVLWIDELDGLDSDYGTLVAVPNRHLVLAHPIRDASVLAVVNHMIHFAIEFEAKGPGSLSRHLYWLHEGVMERLEVTLEDDKVIFRPSDGFTELLNTLA